MKAFSPVTGLAAQGADRKTLGKITSFGLRPKLRCLALTGFLLLSTPDRLAACAFHVALPEASLSDDIAASVEVIAARPSAADPFALAPKNGATSSPPSLPTLTNGSGGSRSGNWTL